MERPDADAVGRAHVPHQEPVWSGTYPHPEDVRRWAAERAAEEADRKARIERMRKFARDVGVGVTTNLVTAAVLYLAAAEAGYIRHDKTTLTVVGASLAVFALMALALRIPSDSIMFHRVVIIASTIIILAITIFGVVADFRTIFNHLR